MNTQNFIYVKTNNLSYIISNAREGDLILLRNLRILPSLSNIIYERLLSGINSKGFSHALMVVGKNLLPTFLLRRDKLYSLDSTTNRFSIPDIYGNVLKGVQIRELNDVLKIYLQNGGEIYWLSINITEPNISRFNIFVRNIYGSKFRNYLKVAGSLLLNDLSKRLDINFQKTSKKKLIKYYMSINSFESICSEFVYSLYVVLGVIKSRNYHQTKSGFEINTLSPSQLMFELIDIMEFKTIYFLCSD